MYIHTYIHMWPHMYFKYSVQGYSFSYYRYIHIHTYELCMCACSGTGYFYNNLHFEYGYNSYFKIFINFFIFIKATRYPVHVKRADPVGILNFPLSIRRFSWIKHFSPITFCTFSFANFFIVRCGSFGYNTAT